MALNLPKSTSLLAVVLIFIFKSGLYGANDKTFTASIVSAETNLPLAATVSITTGQKVTLKPNNSSENVFYMDKEYWYVEGEFSITTGEDSLIIDIRHGLETYPISETIYLPGSDDISKEFKLQRWTNMLGKGYYSGDTHVHFLETKSAHLQMRAEDLQVVNLLTSDFTNDADKFTGQLDQISTQSHLIYVGQEIRDWQMGHVSILQLKELIQPVEFCGGRLLSIYDNPNMLLSPRLEEIEKQKAVSVWAHFSNLPGMESVVAIPLGLIDAIELMTYDDPTQLPSHWEPWDYSEMSQAEFTAMRGMDLYYQYLNTGFNIPITAGTDKMGPNIPVGSNRHYIPIQGDFSYDKWIEGLKSGRGFITNGPMLNFTVEGHMSGDSILFSGEKTVVVTLQAESLLPYGRLEIIANGKLVAWENLKASEQDTIYSQALETEITLSESTWIIGRVTSVGGSRMLPRNLTVFAHSNPIYFLHDGKSTYVPESQKYLRLYQKAAVNWVEKYSNFRNGAERERALQYLQQAKEAISKKF